MITKGPFTIFAPTEAAFGKLISKDPREYNNVMFKDKNLLSKILLQHILPRKLGLTDLRHGDRVLTLAGNRIEISEFGGLKFSDAKILMSTSDRNVGNVGNVGIVHFVGSVVYPLIPSTESGPEISSTKPTDPRPG